MSEQDHEMRALFAQLNPNEAAKARMRERILHTPEPESLPSLTEEWIALLRVRPVMHTAITLSAAAAVLLGMPIFGLAQAVLALFAD